MRKIENINITGFSGTPNVMNYGVNKEFKKQREENPEYDKYLLELKDLLKDEKNKFCIKVFDVLNYNGKLGDIIFNIIPLINTMYNEGYTPSECKDMILSGKLNKFDYCIVYENIKFYNSKYWFKFINEYLDLLGEEDDIKLIELSYQGCALDSSNLKIKDNLRNLYKQAKNLTLRTAIKIPYRNQVLGPKYWNKLNINSKDFEYRAIIEHYGVTQLYKKKTDSIIECLSQGIIKSQKWFSPKFKIYIDSDDSDSGELEIFAKKYGLHFPYEVSDKWIAGGTFFLNSNNLFNFANDLQNIVNKYKDVKFEGILSSFNDVESTKGMDDDHYIKEAIQFVNINGIIGLKVLS